MIVFAIYFHTLNRPWIFYDERVIYEELYAPIANSFKEIIEILSSFGLANNVSSANYLYTSNSVNRVNLLNETYLLMLGFFCKKNPFLYHLLNLVLHIFNSCIVYLIIKKCFSNFNFASRLLIILLTLTWAIHPIQIESVLLSTNTCAILNYSIFFLLFYDFLKNRAKNNLLVRKVTLPLCFLFPMLINECIIALPMILFAYSFINNYYSNNLKQAIKNTWEESQPYLIGLFIYLIYFLFSGFKFVHQPISNPLILTLERIFWLTPQIFVHNLKLIFFPKILSIDQTALIHLGKSLFDNYSIYCILVLLTWLLLPLTLLLVKKKAYISGLLTCLFFISLLPFSQIISPTYCLSAERYLYTPLFFIVFGFSKIINQYFLKSNILKSLIIVFLIIVTSALFTRTWIRTNDWKNNYTLLTSTIKTSSDFLYKGARIYSLAETVLQFEPEKKSKAEKYFKESQSYFYRAIEQLKEEKRKSNRPPIILKFYGLDSDSRIIKAAYFIAMRTFLNADENPAKPLNLFKPYLKNIEAFDPRTLELYANLLIKNNDIDNAKNIFLFTYNKYPASSFILLSLIRFARDIENDLPSAKKYLSEAFRLDPYSKDILFEALRYYQRENNLPEYAKYSYLYGLRTHSKFAYSEALTSYLLLNNLNQAKKTIDKLLFIDPLDPQTLYISSNYYIKKKDYEKAISLLEKAYLINKNKEINQPLSFNIANTLAHLYLALGKTEQATDYANQALSFAKNNPSNIAKIKKFIDDNGIKR